MPAPRPTPDSWNPLTPNTPGPLAQPPAGYPYPLPPEQQWTPPSPGAWPPPTPVAGPPGPPQPQYPPPGYPGWENGPTPVYKPPSLAKTVAVSAAALLFVVTIVGGAGVKLYYIDPNTALVGFLDQSAAAKTGTINADLSADIPASDGSPAFNFSDTMTGSFDLSKPTNPELAVSATATATGNSGGTIAGDARLINNVIYFRGTSLGMLGPDAEKLTNQWFKYPLPNGTFTAHSSCQDSFSSLGATIVKDDRNDIPLTGVTRVGLYESLDGHTVSHYQASIDFSKINIFVSDVDKHLPADCKIPIPTSTYKGDSLGYDIWAGSGLVKIAVQYSDSNGNSIHFDEEETDLGQPVNIVAPDNATDASSWFDNGTPPAATPTLNDITLNSLVMPRLAPA